MANDTRDDLIEILEKMTEAQLRALRQLRRKPAAFVSPRQRKSNMSVIEDILREAEGPLHVREIIERAMTRYSRKLNRESLVSALTKKVLDHTTFCRVGRNTFDLLERHPQRIQPGGEDDVAGSDASAAGTDEPGGS
jgi:hypothetical protein